MEGLIFEIDPVAREIGLIIYLCLISIFFWFYRPRLVRVDKRRE